MEIEQQLKKELAVVEQELAQYGQKDAVTGEWKASVRDMDDSATEPDEIADKHEELEERQDELNALQARKDELVHALEKVQGGTYGKCDVCGEPIEEARLEIAPAAATCSAHAQ